MRSKLSFLTPFPGYNVFFLWWLSRFSLYVWFSIVCDILGCDFFVLFHLFGICQFLRSVNLKVFTKFTQFSAIISPNSFLLFSPVLLITHIFKCITASEITEALIVLYNIPFLQIGCFLLFFFFFFFFFFGPPPRPMEVPRLGGRIRATAARPCQSPSHPRAWPHPGPTPQLTSVPDPYPTEQGQGSNPKPHGS